MLPEIERDGKKIELTREECYQIFLAVLTGITSSVLQSYIKKSYGVADHFDKVIFDRLGREASIIFLDELRDGLYLPDPEDSDDEEAI